MVLKDMNDIRQEADCLRSAAEVEEALTRMAQEITEAMDGTVPVGFCIMNGGLFMTGRLVDKLPFALELDYMHATRYGAETTGGALNWKVRPERSLKGRTVLLMDDILDEGVTLAEIIKYCEDEGAEKVYTAVLVEKMHDRKAPGVKADFVGLQVEDRFLFGCGMDIAGYWRNLPALYAMKEQK
ncbi:hypoxanthine-guanine phosphoribosyltransferase [Geomonas sp. RF6]|uniref:hypoxanthine-guanine phosphoribosyltransferase n=1 Tax=Geomonas sp. RF6 TaxID=2897342 RepID=UPI001E4ADD79|nr:hypoxanthine-guanine phosphoribosyltransferase [Geomonas sp. RF6]UFS72091.1 hypoxanthine-guanine phosphoribosyltransferase [Geomonas sp. RF6]